jgi:molybdopterin biosynthesis enzyme
VACSNWARLLRSLATAGWSGPKLIASDVVRALTGERGARRATQTARAAERFAGRPGWTWYVPAVLDGELARPLALRSAHTSLLARADGYVVVGPDHVQVEPGEPVTLVRYGVWS